MHREEIYVCVECGNSYCEDEVIEDPIGIGVVCPSCGGGCDPSEYECVNCGKDMLSPHSWVWVDCDWCPLCEECSVNEIYGAETLHAISPEDKKIVEEKLKEWHRRKNDKL